MPYDRFTDPDILAEPPTIAPVHPGEILREEFLDPLSISASELARRLAVEVEEVRDVLDGSRRITAELALRLGRLFSTSAELWLGLQQRYDLDRATDRLQGRLMQEVEPLQAA